MIARAFPTTRRLAWHTAPGLFAVLIAGRLFARGLFASLIAAALLALLLTAPLRADCPPGEADFPRFYTETQRGLFLSALEASEGIASSAVDLTGLTLPHHLAAAELIAGGLRLTAARRYDRIVLLHPDHFAATARAFATTRRGFDTLLGPIPGDPEGVERLLGSGAAVEQSCLFSDEHGIRALLPFLARLHPGTPVLPVAVSLSSAEADWDAMAKALAPLVTGRSLVLQSTDFSHYLPFHRARERDQETLNVIAAGDIGGLRALTMPDHLDTLGAMHIQMALQAANGAVPIVVQNRNQAEIAPHDPASTTSYIVAAWAPFPDAAVDIGLPGSTTYLVAGDTFFGRALTRILTDELAARRLAAALDGLTAGLPMVVNLEGVLMQDLPGTLRPMVLGMPAGLALNWLARANVRAVSLANNHAGDVGAFGTNETARLLRGAGIGVAGPGERLDLGALTIVMLTDLDNSRTGRRNLIDEDDLAALVDADPGRAVVAFVHWGREYEPAPGPRERRLARAMEAHGAVAILGAHPHVASDGLALVGPRHTAMAYSLGNFIFDQGADTASGALIELRVFPQGTVFLRRIALPNLYEIARGR